MLKCDAYLKLLIDALLDDIHASLSNYLKLFALLKLRTFNKTCLNSFDKTIDALNKLIIALIRY